MTPETDVLVVGAGPAGSVAAGLLASEGWSVALVDRARFPRPKPCGEAVNPGAVAALRRLGLLDAVLACEPAVIRGWAVRTATGFEAAGSFADPTEHALGVERSRLDGALAREASARGVRFEERVRVADVRRSDGGLLRVSTVGEGGRPAERRARVVVGADGLRSVVSRRTGLAGRGPRLEKMSMTFRVAGRGPVTDRGTLVISDGVTLGVAPVRADGTRWNCTVVVPAGAPARRAARDPVGFLAETMGRSGVRWERPPAVVGGPWASGPFDRPVRSPAEGGVFLVGDAAGYYDPLTGQGIFRAVRSAELAAAAIARTLRRPADRPREEQGYARRLRREFGPGRRLQRGIEAVFARPALRDLAVRRLGAAPGRLDPLIRVTGDVGSPRGLTRPAFWLPLLLP